MIQGNMSINASRNQVVHKQRISCKMVVSSFLVSGYSSSRSIYVQTLVCNSILPWILREVL